MSQHDFDIANQTASNARTDINNALKALASCSSGGTAPTTTYANMLWYDTTNNILKMRNEADSAWISIGYLDQSGSQFQIFDDTKVVNTSGTQTGLIGDQATSSWEAGTSTTESLVSPAKVTAAINAKASVGINQTWQDVLSSRVNNVEYQNTTGKPIMVNVSGGTVGNNLLFAYAGTVSGSLIPVGHAQSTGEYSFVSFVVPDQHYYRVLCGSTPIVWAELR